MDTEMLDVLEDDDPQNEPDHDLGDLPRELRDIIYAYACADNTYNTRNFPNEKIKAITFPLGSQRVLTSPTSTTSAELQATEHIWPGKCPDCGCRFTRKVDLKAHIHAERGEIKDFICDEVDLTESAKALPNTTCDGSAVCRQMLEEVTPIVISNTTSIFHSPAEFERFMKRFSMIRDLVATAHVHQHSGLFQPSAAFSRILDSCPCLKNLTWYAARAI
ncbi:hypothetical protein LTR37_015520 [Vermiconidia calcicola]|uniref:Uncharacterized protein n=1 Tax=Vermiconidia calcicola TaxID=1690605 RepID=A0ACC3MQL4_9PEZI|nr:hypothetical protein LTR37_015520 [Vermiconidia calcicola]